MFTKDKLVFDTTDANNTDNVGAYLRSSNGTLITHTTVSGKEALDVNVANTVTVSATDLDIRDLAFATDSVDVSGSEVSLDATTLAALESITVQNGAGVAAVNIQDGGNSITVDATDLDIRNLDYSQDNMAIKGSTGNQLVVNADGSINANVDVSVVSGSDKAEDSAHSSADIGTYILAVRQDTLASSVSSDGDYGSLKLNSLGALYTEVTKAASPTNTSWLVTQTDIFATAALVVASDLSSRKRILIQNVGGKVVYLGDANTVTSANGMILAKGGSVELDLAAGVGIYAISDVVGTDLRIAELA